MAKYKEKSAKRSGSTVKLFDAVVRHFYPTRRAAAIFLPELSKPLPVVTATHGGLFLAGRKISCCRTLILFVSRA
jgi:hypothetical protein